jgi:kumamolisin
VFARPSWQTGLGTTTATPAGSTGQPVPPNVREVPDVSADGDPLTGNTIIEGGKAMRGGGTSLAAPIWAAFCVLIDQYLVSLHRHELGFLNPTLYALAQNTQRYPPFNDVTIGGNDFFAATPGYDMVTGLGSPDVYNLARDLSGV